jgi:hypothetical protein
LLRNVRCKTSAEDYVGTGNHRVNNGLLLKSVADDAAQYWSLCVTSDGTESEIIGIISEHDVLPLRLIILG